MDKTAWELARELQGVALDESAVARAVALTEPINRIVRETADAILRFEDEPAAYLGLLREEGRRHE